MMLSIYEQIEQDWLDGRITYEEALWRWDEIEEG